MAADLPPDRQTIHEFGREYGAYRTGQYLFPYDEKERDRLDIMHTMFMVVREAGKRLTNCPTDRLSVETSGWQQPPRILDLGCGTGIWMLEMAQRFSNAEFVGVDLHHMGPAKLEPNVVYTSPWDFEGPWALGEKSWDLIHLQMGLGSVQNWEALYKKILKHLVPGTGYFESVEMDFEPRTTDATPLKGMLVDWWHTYLRGSYAAAGRRLHYDPDTKTILEGLGFRDVQHKQYIIPMNEWPQDEQAPDYQVQRRAAMWWHVAMGPGEDGHGGHGLEALSLMPLCKFSSWPPEHVTRLCRDALAQASDPNVHAFNILHVITARAPGPDDA